MSPCRVVRGLSGGRNSWINSFLCMMWSQGSAISSHRGRWTRKYYFEGIFLISKLICFRMNTYVDNVKRNVVGQGTLHELGIGRTISQYEFEEELDDLPPPLPSSLPPFEEIHSSSPPPLPPPPMNLLNLETLSHNLPDLEHNGPNPVQGNPDYNFNQMNTSHRSIPPYMPSISQHTMSASHLPNSALSSNSQRSPLLTDGPNEKATLSNGISKVVSSDHQPSNGWTCSGCGQSMLPGDIAIFAERAGHEKCWHPSCFSCNQCGEMLEDLLYYHYKGNLYCGRDYAQLLKIPRCSACDELIFSAEYTGAEDSFWHIKHFCCWLCDSPLAGEKYIPVEGQPHCLSCWQVNHGKVCSACGEYIDPQGQRVTLGEKHWHASPMCFKCGICQASLLGGKMSRKHGTLLCSSKCGQVLADRIYNQQVMEEDSPRSVYKVSDL